VEKAEMSDIGSDVRCLPAGVLPEQLFRSGGNFQQRGDDSIPFYLYVHSV
jgi:hypothetical protein